METSVLAYMCICILLIDLQCSNAYEANGSKKLHQADEAAVLLRRWRRSPANTIRSILSKTIIKFQSKGYLYVQKNGNYRDALKDFRRLNPTEVIREGLRTRGTSDDLMIVLFKGERKRADLTIHYRQADNNEKVVIEYVPR